MKKCACVGDYCEYWQYARWKTERKKSVQPFHYAVLFTTVQRRSTFQKQTRHILFQEMSMETIKRQLYNSGSVREVWGWLKTPCWDGTQEHSKFKKNIHASDCPAHRDIRRWRSSWQTYQKAVKGTKVKLNLNRPWRPWGEAELQLYSSFKLGTRPGLDPGPSSYVIPAHEKVLLAVKLTYNGILCIYYFVLKRLIFFDNTGSRPRTTWRPAE